MKIEVISLDDDTVERREYRNAINIRVDDKSVFSVYDGEPEDANLNRDFSDVWGIPDLMRMAHTAGVKGEELRIEYKEVDEI